MKNKHFLQALFGVALMILPACKSEKVTPLPSPLPPVVTQPTPLPGIFTPLRAINTKFSQHLRGAVICCTEPYAVNDGWPLINEAALEKLASFGINATHIRTGPFTREGERAEYEGYMRVGNKYDLSHFNEQFFNRLAEIVEYANFLGIYIEVDLIDAWVLERPEVSPWTKENNIQHYNFPGCKALLGGPTTIPLAWVEKVVTTLQPFQNVFYQIGNETFDCNGEGSSLAWEVGIYQLAKNISPGKMVGTNSHNQLIEVNVDYGARHALMVPSETTYPLIMNEYESISLDDFKALLSEGKRKGVDVFAWRGNLNSEDWNEMLTIRGEGGS